MSFFIQQDAKKKKTKQQKYISIFCTFVCVCVHVYVYTLLWFEVSVNDAKAVKVVERQGEFSQVKLYVLLCEHHLEANKCTAYE